MHSGSVGVCLSCLGQMDAGKSFLLGMWGFVWVDGLVSFLLEVVLGRMKYKKKCMYIQFPFLSYPSLLVTAMHSVGFWILVNISLVIQGES